MTPDNGKRNYLNSSHSGYHAFEDAEGSYGSFEVFWSDGTPAHTTADNEDHDAQPCGWYWWACFPGCLPDGDANGPFESSFEAWQDAQND